MAVWIDKEVWERKREKYAKAAEEETGEAKDYLIDGNWRIEDIEYKNGTLTVTASLDEHLISLEIPIDKGLLLKMSAELVDLLKEVIEVVETIKDLR